MTPKNIAEVEKETIETLNVNKKLFPLQFGKDMEKQEMIILNHFQNSETMKSLIILAKNNKSGDVAILSRSIFESVLNMGLLLFLSYEEGVNRYKKFLSIEALKIYRHMAKIEKQVADKIYKPAKITSLEKDVKEYEIRYGKPKLTWSGLNSADLSI